MISPLTGGTVNSQSTPTNQRDVAQVTNACGFHDSDPFDPFIMVLDLFT